MEYSVTYIEKNVSPWYYKLQEYAGGTCNPEMDYNLLFHPVGGGNSLSCFMVRKWYVTDHTCTMEKT